MRKSLVRAFFLLLGATLPAFASDGVIEINQAKALAGFVTPSDTPGFPVTIDAPGSYRLTGNLDVRVVGLPTSANTTAIEVSPGVDAVSIDLGGFSILGPATCSNSSCSNTGTGIGIQCSICALAVRDGAIVGMGSDGILQSASPGSARIERVSLRSNGGNGVSQLAGVIESSIATRNGQAGFSAGTSAVRASSALGNLGKGIGVVGGSIDGCVVGPVGASAFSITVTDGSLRDSVAVDALLGGIGALFCSGNCSIGGNKFVGCSGAACIGGGSILQTPTGSNQCGDVVCP